MTQTTDQTHPLTKPSKEQQVEIDQQLASHLQKIEIA